MANELSEIELLEKLDSALKREITVLGSLNLVMPRLRASESLEDVYFWCDVLVNNVLTTREMI